MASFVKFNCFVADLGLQKHKLDSDVMKVMLTNTLPAATNAVTTDITEIASGNGYAAGGATATTSSWTQTSGVAKLILADPPTWQASGGTIGPFQYAVLYNSTSATKPLIGYWAYTGALTLNVGETFFVDLDQTNGTLQLA